MWFLVNKSRLARERKEITNLINNGDWLIDGNWSFDGNKLCFTAKIIVHEQLYPVRLLYPNGYPANPPSIYPQEPHQRWSGHQYGQSGELCLEWGPDNWHENVTGADILSSAYKLLHIENPLGEESPTIEAPSRHFLTLGQEIRTSLLRFISNTAFVEEINTLSQDQTGKLNIIIYTSRPIFTAFVINYEYSNGEKWQNTVLPSKLKNNAIEFEACLVKTTLNSKEIGNIDIETFRNLLQSNPYVQQQQKEPTFVIFIDKEEKPHLIWCTKERELHRFTTLTVNEQQNSRLGPDIDRLSNKSLGIVGLGSAGSKIALSLARSGVRNFYLVDHDIFLPENICRHELTWEDIGQHKVDAIEHKLDLISSDIQVKSRKLMISGQEASASLDSVLTALGECDLIIDASADPIVFNYLSATTTQYETPMIWLEIFSGGIGGYIARYRPGVEPDPKSMRKYLIGYLENQDKPQLISGFNYSAMTDEGEIIVATDADVGVIASNATRMAIDKLIEREPSSFPYSMYLIGLESGWIFKEPFYTIPINLTDLHSDSPEIESTNGDFSETNAFIKKLLDNPIDENPSSN